MLAERGANQPHSRADLLIEFSLVEKDIVFGLQQGNSVLKEIHKEMNLDKVEQLMSDTAEGIVYQNVRSHLTLLDDSGADGFCL